MNNNEDDDSFAAVDLATFLTDVLSDNWISSADENVTPNHASPEDQEVLQSYAPNGCQLDENYTRLCYLSHKFPRAGVSLRTTASYFQNFVKAFNLGDTDRINILISEVFENSCTHKSRIGEHLLKLEGLNQVIQYNSAVLTSFPDAILLVRSMKYIKRQGYRIIRCKMGFAGTEVQKGTACSMPVPSDYISDSLDPETYSDKERARMKDLETSLKANGTFISIFVKVNVSIFIDEVTNRIQSFDQCIKLSSFKALEQ